MMDSFCVAGKADNPAPPTLLGNEFNNGYWINGSRVIRSGVNSSKSNENNIRPVPDQNRGET
jgi:hypothetical protein